MSNVENFDFRFNLILHHSASHLFEIGQRIVVDTIADVDGSGIERDHFNTGVGDAQPHFMIGFAAVVAGTQIDDGVASSR